jgi:hypothetical protein
VTDWKDAWWEDAFNSAVQNVQRVGESSSSSSSSSDEEDGDVEVRRNRDGTLASASVEELQLLESLAKSSGRVAAGRFGGRDAKMERIRRQEAIEAAKMAEKLGLSTAVRVNSDSQLNEKDVEQKKKKKKGTKNEDDGIKRKKKKSSSDSKRIVIECGKDDKSEEECHVVPTPRDGWWGCNLFISAGALSGAALEVPIDKIKVGFSEDQQAKIYERAQNGKTTGKVGLGKGKRGTIKIDGVAWQGTKKTFEEEDETVKDDKVKKEFKWKKVIAKVLKKKGKKPKGLKIKHLHKHVVKLLSSSYSVEMEKREVKQGIDTTLAKYTSVFLTSGEYVALC